MVFSQKLGNTELNKVPIERLHVRKKMPVVPKQSWTETLGLHRSIRDSWRWYSHEYRAKEEVQHQVHLWFVRKTAPLSGERNTPLTDVRAAPKTFNYIQLLYKIRKPWEVSSGVKYRPQNAHKDQLLQKLKFTNWRQIKCNWSIAQWIKADVLGWCWHLLSQSDDFPS